MKWLFRWLVPGGILLVGALVLRTGLGPAGPVEGAVSGYSWVVFGVAGFLAVFFHRSRVAVATLATGATAWVASSQAGGDTAVFFAGASLAVTLGLLALLKDRGVLSLPGLLQVGVFCVFGAFIGLFLRVAPGDMALFLSKTPLPASLVWWSRVPQPVLLAYGLALPTTLLVALLRNGPADRGIFWALTTAGVGLFLDGGGPVGELFLMVAGLILGLSVLETSYAMAYQDDLTGLPARRALARDLEGIGGLYSAAMVDVDRFKRFNDRHGHDVGDQVLRLVAAQLARVRGGGRAYRYGGEEFTLLFPGKAKKDTLEHLEEVRGWVEEATFTLRHWRRPKKKPVDPGGWKFSEKPRTKRLSVTVSIGVADSTGSEVDPEEVLKKADRALYRAKRAGRNRVTK